MSAKDAFRNRHQPKKTLLSSSMSAVGDTVESAEYIGEFLTEKNRFIPDVDFRTASNFARYGSAANYYEDATKWIYEQYPYDGSLKEKLEWHNSSSYLDLYVFENLYPRTNGYINLSPGGFGTRTEWSNGYGATATASYEYIQIKGGPHGIDGGSAENTLKEIFDSKANVYNEVVTGSGTRETNLKTNLTGGVTLEFWMKKPSFDLPSTEKEVIFDLWNGESANESTYGRLRLELNGKLSGAETRPFLLTCRSGSQGFTSQVVGSGASVNNIGVWRHYAVSLENSGSSILTRFYIDGDLTETQTLGSTINEITGALIANIGALRYKPENATGSSDNYPQEGWGKLSGSLDEFRFWKTRRTSEQIGRYWFTQVGGGTNTDVANTTLGVYYKFNEGVTGTGSTDATVLDYSGRISNGSWVGYSAAGRSTGSAMVEATASAAEFKDPIIYSYHPKVQDLQTELASSGSLHDHQNNASIYYSIPTWIIEEDLDHDRHTLKKLTQILGSYFDNLHLQIEAVPSLHDIDYSSGSVKPAPFMRRMLQSKGFPAPELFADANILEALANRSEDTNFEDSLHDIKNIIYKNIYNNLIQTYKAKGTEKAFRNLIRCFGVDEELVKVSMYGDNVVHKIEDVYTSTVRKKRYIDFNHPDRFNGTIYQYTASSNANSVSYISGSGELDYEDNMAFTVETEVLFPKKFSESSVNFFATNFISSSICGMHTVDSHNNFTADDFGWASNDYANFQIFALRPEIGSNDVRFALSCSSPYPFSASLQNQGSGDAILTSSLYSNVYDDQHWNFAVRVKPDGYPHVGLVTGSTGTTQNYIVEFYGVNVEVDRVMNEFLVTGTMDYDAGRRFLRSAKRLYAGAHRQAFTGSTLQKSDVKFSSLRYWCDYLDNETIKAHARDIANVGTINPYRHTHLLPNILSGTSIPSIETLVLNWDFETVTGSDDRSANRTVSDAKFLVQDVSSGSLSAASSRYDWLGNIVKKQHTGRGDFFLPGKTDVVDARYTNVAKQHPPEVLNPAHHTVQILTRDDTKFVRDHRPTRFFFAIEKSMYRTISEEMINMFATIVDFNNLIGEPVNRYRQEYKDLAKLRQLFFDRIGNSPDLDKYIEYYKWIDSALSEMIQQLIPASANFSEGMRTMIESHVLERNKYWSKFPTLELSRKDPEATLRGIEELTYDWEFGSAPAQSWHNGEPEQDKNCRWWQDRADRESEPLASVDDGGSAKVDEHREIIKNVITTHHSHSGPRLATSAGVTYEGSTYALRRLSRPYKFNVEESKFIHGGINYSRNKNREYARLVTHPHGPIEQGALSYPLNIGIMRGFKFVGEQDCDDKHAPNTKVKRRFMFEQGREFPEGYSFGKGALLAPFNIYSSSVRTGYNKEVYDSFSEDIEITNVHSDTYLNTNEIPMQGPFTDTHVGGQLCRHVDINRYDATKVSLNKLDDYKTRPEAWMLLVGSEVDNSGVEQISTGGVIGLAGYDYPYPEGNETSPSYPVTGAQPAYYYREETVKRPVNIRNIKHTTSSYTLGNYSKNYQVVQTSGRSTNNLYFNNNGITLPERYQDEDLTHLPKTTNVHTLVGVDPTSHGNTFSHDRAKAYYTDGTTDRHRSAGLSTAGSNVTVSIWIFRTVDTVQYVYFRGATNASSGDYLQFNLGGTVQWASNFSTTDGKWTTAGKLELNKWHNIIVTYNATNVNNNPSIYIDGELQTLTETQTPVGSYVVPASQDVISYAGTAAFDGYYADLAVWDVVVDSDEIAKIYNNGIIQNLFSLDGSRSNLVAWWTFGLHPQDTNELIVNLVNSSNNFNNKTGNGKLVDLDLATTAFVPPPRLSTSRISADTTAKIPDRGKTESVIVERFSAPGGPEINTKGYLDIIAEEKSVYNALPWRNLSIRGSGSGENGTFRMANHLRDSNDVATRAPRDGLQTLLSRHAGQFGHDSTYGSVKANEYVTVPSYHKVNRNGYNKPQLDEFTENFNTKYAAFDGTSDRLTSVTYFNFRSITISAWVLITNEGGARYILTTNGAAGILNYLRVESDETLSFRADFTDTNGVWSTGAPVTSDNWIHVAVTYDLNTTDSPTTVDPKFYINGGLVESTEGTAPVGDPSSNSAQIYVSSATSNALAGRITDMSLWTKALTAEEVLEIYNGTFSYEEGPADLNHHSAKSDLEAWWRFGDGSHNGNADAINGTSNEDGNRIYDMATNSNHLYTSAGNPSIATATGSFVLGERTMVGNVKKYDNWYVQHPIPATDLGYAWITASVMHSDRVYGHMTGSAITFLSASDFGSMTLISNGKRYWGETHRYASTNGSYKDFLPTDFVGMHYHIYEPVSGTENFMGYAGTSDLRSYLNQGGPEQQDDITSGDPDGGFIADVHDVSFNRVPHLFHALMLHRNGPYGYPSWKQVRTGEHSIAKDFRRRNKISIIKPGSKVRGAPFKPDGYDGIPYNATEHGLATSGTSDYTLEQYTEMPVVSKYRPITHVYNPAGQFAFGFPLAATHTYANNLSLFSNETLNDRLNIVKTDRQVYDDLTEQYTVPQGARRGPNGETILDYDNSLISLTYRETVFPRLVNTYSKDVRTRKSGAPHFLLDFWKSSREDRNESRTTSQGASKLMSMWPLDARSDFTTDAHERYANTNSSGVGELQNNFTIVHSRYASRDPGGGIGEGGGDAHETRENLVATPIYARRQTSHTASAGLSPSGPMTTWGSDFAQANSGDAGAIGRHQKPGAWSITNVALVERYAGETLWEAGEQAGKYPFYNNYTDYAANMRLIGKDYSIVPEFRISERMDYYTQTAKGDFLYDDPDTFSLTGAIPSADMSSDDNFYKTYSHSDFMRYFSVIEDDYKGIAEPTTISVTCKALMKFLPYNGFYPVLRTLELANLFSQSYGEHVELTTTQSGSFTSEGMWRAFLAPFYAPGIMYNTIKSGIAVDWPAFTASNEVTTTKPIRQFNTITPNVNARISNPKFHFRIPFEAIIEPHQYVKNKQLIDSEPHALARMEATASLTSRGDERYSLAMNNFLAEVPNFFLSGLSTLISKTEKQFDRSEWSKVVGASNTTQGDDPDVCFMSLVKLRKSLTTPRSASIGRPNHPPQAANYDGASYANWIEESITMYSRPSAFGPPSAGANTGSDSRTGINLPFTPPYYDGEAWAVMKYTPTRTQINNASMPTLDEIQENTTVTYIRVEEWQDTGVDAISDVVGPQDGAVHTTHIPGLSIANLNAMQVSASLNLFGMVDSGLPNFTPVLNPDLSLRELQFSRDTETKAKRWAIQTKFETPILNFRDATVTKPANGAYAVAKGMWHQYGTIPAADEGIYMEVTDLTTDQILSPNSQGKLNAGGNVSKSWPAGNPKFTGSLRQLVGFPTEPKKLGTPRQEKTIREAVVAVPFIECDGKRQFFTIFRDAIDRALGNVGESAPPAGAAMQAPPSTVPGESVVNMVDAMQRYVFPPKMNFLLYDGKDGRPEVEPFAMYIFEFEHKLNQQDLADIWQNLPPRIGHAFDDKYVGAEDGSWRKEGIADQTLRTDEIVQEKTISHRLDVSELMGIYGVESGKKLQEKLQWMVFKVKQKAEWNYKDQIVTQNDRSVISDKINLSRMLPMAQLQNEFKPNVKAADTRPDYNYNWPYDFFSLVELVKIDEEVVFTTGTEPISSIQDNLQRGLEEDAPNPGPGMMMQVTTE